VYLTRTSGFNWRHEAFGNVQAVAFQVRCTVTWLKQKTLAHQKMIEKLAAPQNSENSTGIWLRELNENYKQAKPQA
jgi:hypothetical protein